MMMMDAVAVMLDEEKREDSDAQAALERESRKQQLAGSSSSPSSSFLSAPAAAEAAGEQQPSAAAVRSHSPAVELLASSGSSSAEGPLSVSSSSSDGASAWSPQRFHGRSSSLVDADGGSTAGGLLALQRQSTVIQHENAFRSFVPISVEHFLAQHNAYSLLSAPAAYEVEGAMLFVDMSGFTPLSERLSSAGMIGIESLSTHLNHYFGSMVDIIHRYEGDVTKFAGDALMILFAADSAAQQQQQQAGGRQSRSSSLDGSIGSLRRRRRDDDSEYVGDEADDDERAEAEQRRTAEPALRPRLPNHEGSAAVSPSPSPSGPSPASPAFFSTSSSSPRSSSSAVMRELTLRACSCALAIHNQFDGFVPEVGVTLRLHSAVSAGRLYGVHVGGHNSRWEWLLKGKPLAELGQAMKSSEKGQIVLHPSAMQRVDGLVTTKPIRAQQPVPPLTQQTLAAAQRKNSLVAATAATASSLSSHAAAVSSHSEEAAVVCHLLLSDLPPVVAHRSKRPHLTISVPPASPDALHNIAAAAVRPSPTAASIAIPLPSSTVQSPASSSSPSPTLSSALQYPHRTYSALSSYLQPSRPLAGVGNGGGGWAVSPQASLSLHDFFLRRSQQSQSLSPTIDGDSSSSSSFPTPALRSSTLGSSSRFTLSEEDEIRCERALRAYVPSAVVARVEAGHRAWLAEFRRVTTLFILLPEHDFDSADAAVRAQSLQSFQAVVSLCMEVCFKHKGDIRQLITDDKGTVMILLFGLQADWANPLRGVRAALEIVERFAALRAAQETQTAAAGPVSGAAAASPPPPPSASPSQRIAIGITTGKVFCGTVGNHLRCEYTAVGDKVNTAARLMVAVAASPSSAIYCDADTVQATGNATGIAFKSLPAIMVKGKAAPVAIFSPFRRSQSARSQQSLQHFDLSWGKKMSGRVQQRQAVESFLSRAVSKDAQLQSDRCNVLYIEAVARGVGKSVLLSAAYACCVQLNVVVLIGVANDSESTPYLVFESMIPKMLKLLRDVEVGECSLRPDGNDAETGMAKQRLDRQGQARAVNDEDDSADDEEDSKQADWLHDPDVLAIPDELKTSGQLCLLNDLCSTVNFQHTEGITISINAPPASVASFSPTLQQPDAGGGFGVRSIPQLSTRSSSVVFSRSVSVAVTPSNGAAASQLLPNVRYDPSRASPVRDPAIAAPAALSLSQPFSLSLSSSRDGSIPASPATGGSDGQHEQHNGGSPRSSFLVPASLHQLRPSFQPSITIPAAAASSHSTSAAGPVQPTRHQSELYPNAPRSTRNMFARSTTGLLQQSSGSGGSRPDGPEAAVALPASTVSFLTPPSAGSPLSSPVPSPSSGSPAASAASAASTASPPPHPALSPSTARPSQCNSPALAAQPLPPRPPLLKTSSLGAALPPTAGFSSSSPHSGGDGVGGPHPLHHQTSISNSSVSSVSFSSSASPSPAPSPVNAEAQLQQSDGLSIPVPTRSNTGSVLPSRLHSRHSSIAPSPMRRTHTVVHPGVLLGAASPSASAALEAAAAVHPAVPMPEQSRTGANRAAAIESLIIKLLQTLRDTRLAAGICIMVDNADCLDSASEHLLLALARQLPWLCFIFAARRHETPCSLKQALIPFQTRAEKEKEAQSRREKLAARRAQQRTMPNPASKQQHHRRSNAHRPPNASQPLSPQPQLRPASLSSSSSDPRQAGAASATGSRAAATRYDVGAHSRHKHRRKLSSQSPVTQAPAAADELQDAQSLLRRPSLPRQSLSVPATSLAASVSATPASVSPSSSPALSPSAQPSAPVSPMRSPLLSSGRSLPAAGSDSLAPPTRANARAGSMTVNTARFSPVSGSEPPASLNAGAAAASSQSRSPSGSPQAQPPPSRQSLSASVSLPQPRSRSPRVLPAIDDEDEQREQAADEQPQFEQQGQGAGSRPQQATLQPVFSSSSVPLPAPPTRSASVWPTAARASHGQAILSQHAAIAAQRHRGLSSAEAAAHRERDGDGADADESEPSAGPAALEAVFVELGGLNEEDMSELLQSVLRCQGVDAAVVQAVLERSNGIPLYAEEMALQLQSSGIIQLLSEQLVTARQTLAASCHSAALTESGNSSPASSSAAPSAPPSASSSPQHRQSVVAPAPVRLPSLDHEREASSPNTAIATSGSAAVSSVVAVSASASGSSQLLHHGLPALPRSASHTFSIPHHAAAHSPAALPAASSLHALAPSPHHAPLFLPAQPSLQQTAHGQSAAAASASSSAAPPPSPSLQLPAPPPLAPIPAFTLPAAAQLNSSSSAKEPLPLIATAGLFSPPQLLLSDAPSSPHPSSSSRHRPSSRVTQLQEREQSSSGSVGLARHRSRAQSPSRPVRLIACFAASAVGGGSSAGGPGGGGSAALQQLDLSSIPESLDEMIAAQIDALPPDLQLLLKMCAVFGRLVDSRCIRRVWLIFGARRQRKRKSKPMLPAPPAAADRPGRAAAAAYTSSSASAAAGSSSRASGHRGEPSAASPPVSGSAALQSVVHSHDFDSDMQALVERGWLKSLRDDGGGTGNSSNSSGSSSSSSSRAAAEDEQLLTSASAALYSFKYAVAVNVAYNRLPFSFRGVLHRCIGEWYEELYAVQPCPQYLPKLAFHWQQAAMHIADSSSGGASTPASGGPGSASSPSSSSLSTSPHTPSTPQSTEPSDESPGRTAATVVRHESSEPSPAHTGPPPLPHSHSVSVAPLPPSAASGQSQSQRQSLTSAPSASAVLHCRQRAIHWLREAGEAAAKQGARREAATWLSRAMELIELLPDKQSLRWRRELLQLLTLYCPTHSVLVGLVKALPDWSRLCSLCEEVQQRSEQQRRRRQQFTLEDEQRRDETAAAETEAETQREDGVDDEEASAAVARSTFYALRGYHLALHNSASQIVDLDASLRISERLLVIAQHSDDWLMLSHALYIIAVQRLNVGDYEKALELCAQIWQLFLPHDSLPFVVNPLAPVDPALCSLCIAANAHCVMGRMEQAVEDVDRALAYAERNGEPVNHQYVLGMHCFILLQLDKLEVQAERLLQYSVYAAAESGSQSTLYEIVMALFQAFQEPDDLLFIQQAADRCWARYQSGHRFFVAFNSPLCQLLLLAGRWSEGLSFCASWRRLSHDGALSNFFPDCVRYEAMFLLQQAEAAIEEEQLLSLQQQQQVELSEPSVSQSAQDDEHSRQLSFAQGDRPVFLQRPLSDPLPLTSAGSASSALAVVSPPVPDTGESSSSSSSSSSSGASSAAESLQPSRAASPVQAVDVWQLRDEARALLNEAVALAFRMGAKLLEMKAVMTLIPLLRFLSSAASQQQQQQQHSLQPLDSPRRNHTAPYSPLSASTSAADGHSRHQSLPSLSQPALDDNEGGEDEDEQPQQPPPPEAAALSSPQSDPVTPQLSQPEELRPSKAALHGAELLLPSPVSQYEAECRQHEQRLRILLEDLQDNGDFVILHEARDMLGLSTEQLQQPDSPPPSHLRQQSYTEGHTAPSDGGQQERPDGLSVTHFDQQQLAVVGNGVDRVRSAQ